MATLTGEVMAVEKPTGAVRWTASLPAAVVAGWAAAGDVLVIITAAGVIQGRDLATGAWRWEDQLPAPVIGAPVIVGDTEPFVIVVDDQGGVRAWRVATGEQVWQLALPAAPAAPLAAGGEWLCCPLNDGRVALIAWRTWETRIIETGFTALPLDLAWDGNALIVAAGSSLLSLEPATGSTNWIIELPEPISASPIVTENGIWAGTANGTLHLLAPTDGVELRAYALTGAVPQSLTAGLAGIAIIDRLQRLLVLALPGWFPDDTDAWEADTAPYIAPALSPPPVEIAQLLLSPPIENAGQWQWPYQSLPQGCDPARLQLHRYDAEFTPVPIEAADQAVVTTAIPEVKEGWFALVLGIGGDTPVSSPLIYVDFQPPRVAVQVSRVSPEDTSLLITGTVTDRGGVEYQLRVLTPDGQWRDVAFADGSGTTATAPVADGTLAVWTPSESWTDTVRFVLTATDQFGNEASAETTYELDAAPPELSPSLEGTVVTVGGELRTGPGVRLVLTATDLGSGVERIEYSLAGGAPVNYVGSVEFTQDGTYDVTARAYDAAGNASGAKTIKFVVDAIPPAAPQVYGVAASDYLGASGATLTCHAAGEVDPTYAVSYRGADGVWHAVAAGPGPEFGWATGELAEGTYWLGARAADVVGNQSALTEVGPLTLDLTSPAPAFADLRAILSGNSVTLFAWETMNDAGSGMDRYELYRSTTGFADGDSVLVLVTSDGPDKYYYDLPPVATVSTYLVYGIDRVGNYSEPSNQVAVTTSADLFPPSAGFGEDSRAIDALAIDALPGTLALRIGWAEDPATDQYGIDHHELYRQAELPITELTDSGLVALDLHYHNDGSFAYVDTAPLIEGLPYYYVVVAVDPSGNRSPLPLIPSLAYGIPDATPPEAATVLSPAGTGIDGIQLTHAPNSPALHLDWSADPPTDNVGVAAIEVYRAVGAGEEALLAEVGTETTGYWDTALPGATPVSYRLRARDAAGNAGPYSLVRAETSGVDLEPPTALTIAGSMAINGIRLYLTSDRRVLVDWSADPATDPSGISRYSIYRARTVFGPGLPTVPEKIAEVPYTEWTELRWFDPEADQAAGDLFYAVTATDNWGNEMVYGAASAIALPNLPPIVSLFAATGELAHGKFAIQGSVRDADLASYRCGYDTGGGLVVLASGSIAPTSDTLAILDTVKLADGPCLLVLTAADQAGQNCTTTVIVTVDNTAPSVTLNAPPANFFARTGFTLELTGNDPHLPLDWWVSIGNAAGDTLWATQGRGDQSIALVNPLVLSGPEGKVTIRYQIADAVGNLRSGSRTGTYLPNSPAPAPVIINEVQAMGEAWGELLCRQGPINVAKWKLTDLDGTDTSFAAGTVTMNTGDLLVVRWGAGTDEADKVGGGWIDANGNGVRDLYLEDPIPSGTDDQVVLMNGDTVVDAVAYSDYDGSLPETERDDLGFLYDRWGWDPDGREQGQAVSAPLPPYLWGVMGRRPGSPDTNRKEDWAAYGRATPGLPNQYVPPPPAGAVLINEVQTDNALVPDEDWAELYCVSGPVDVGLLVLSDLDTIDEEGILSGDAPVTLQTGEYCVIHFSPVTGENETDDDTEGNWTDRNGNGVRDLYSSEPPIPSTDEQLVLYAVDGSIVDAVSWSNRDGELDPDEAGDNLALVDAGAWTGDGGQPSAAFRRGRTYPLGRVPNGYDRDLESDWQMCFATPGAANQAVGENRIPPQSWLESSGPLLGDGTDTVIAPATKFYLNSYDDLSGVASKQYQVDNDPVAGYGTPFSIAAEGVHTIRYWAVDEAGNAEPEQMLRVYCDATPPAVILTLDDRQRLVISAADAGAGIKDIAFSHVGQALEPYVGPAAFYGPGEYRVWFEVTDRVGNLADDRQLVIVPVAVPAPTLEPIPELTTITTLQLGGVAVSGERVEIVINGTSATATTASVREVTVPLSAFTERSAGVVEESGYLTLAPYRELWADNFDDGDYNGWQVISGSWRVVDGELRGDGVNFTGIEQPTVISEPEYSIVGTMRNESPHWDLAFAFQVQGWDLYRLETWQPNWAGLQKHITAGDQWSAIGPTGNVPEYAVGVNLPFRIDKFADGSMRASINGLSLSGQDAQYTAGHVRFWGWHNDFTTPVKVALDDVRVFTGAPREGTAQAGPVALAGLGRIAAILVTALPGDGEINLYDGTDPATRVPLYRWLGEAPGAITPGLGFWNPEPLGGRPVCSVITFVGWSDYSATVTLAEGENRLVAYAEDGDGNRSAPSDERVVVLDTHAPVVSGLAASPPVFSPDGNGVDDQTEISFTFADNLPQYPGSLKVEVRDAAGAAVRELLNYAPAAYGARTIIWDGKNTAEEAVDAGVYRVVVTGADAAGNRVEAEAVVTVQYDVTPPQIEIAVPAENGSYSYALPLTLQWTISDSESGVANSSATLDGTGVTSGQTLDLKALGIGSHSITVTATDNAGNAATVTAGFTVIDDIPPTITLFQPATPTNQDISLQYTVYDEITATPTVTGDNSPYTAEGNYIIVLTATDEAGNQAISNAVTFTIDKTAPTTTLTVGTPSYNDFITSATPLTLAAPDNLTTLTTQYRLDGGAWQAYAGVFTLTGEGAHTVGYQSTDAARNVETEQTRTLVVDNSAPASALAADLLSADGTVAVPETKSTLTATDAASGVEKIEYRVNSGNWVAYTAPSELREVAGLGPVTLGYRAVDRLGNAEVERIASYTVKPALELEAGLLTTPRVLCWWNYPHEGEGRGEGEDGPRREQWTAALTAAFDSAALEYLIVETPAEFLAKLSDYNVYLIVGDEKKLESEEEGEEEEENLGDSLVAAQVALGKTLISFGYEDLKTPDGEDRGWENVFGIKVDGVLNGTANLAVYPDLVAETRTMTVEGRTERIKEVLSGEVLGEVSLIEHGDHGDDEHGDRRHSGRGEGDGDGHGEGDDEHNDTWPAIVANNWGDGKVLYLAPDHARNLATLSDILKNAILWSAPGQEVVQAGGVVGIGIKVRNAVLPMVLRVNVESYLPTGSDAITVYDGGEDRGSYVVWFDDLPATVKRGYRFLLRLPTEVSGCTVHIEAAYLKEGQYRLVGSKDLVLQ